MKPFLLALGISAAFVHCGPPKLTHTGQPTATTRYNSGASPTIPAKVGAVDTITVTGSEYLQVSGRNENGMYPDLEGRWEMIAMPGTNFKNTNNIIKDAASVKGEVGKPYTGAVIGDAMKGSSEVKRETVNDGTNTTTTVYLVNKQSSETRITPPQGSSFHTPEAPSLNLFGSNETFSGFTGCNKIAGRYTLKSNNGITFRHSAPSTRMACIGDYDEKAFLQSLQRVNKYKSTGTELQLLDGEEVLFVFSRK
ncbi:META domain-containing protein [Aridibaculum aurantiacum]|uniref:META domain-containing protein n=1 Tax=Aridibaculum aurantiacum TaxID=2810307 RepID=UPI001A977F3E|nr:META domain-containing protein [Aridibaculum aurantiacum]